jgi:uncharacterized protein YycO
MRYISVPRGKLKVGDILLTSSTTCISRLIKWWTISRWSHVGIYVGNNFVIEATWPRVRKVTLMTFLESCDRVTVLRHSKWTTLTEDQVQQFLGFLESKIGKPYDWRGLVSFICRKSIQNKSGYFCSELVSEAFSLVGIPIERKKPAWTSPEDIHSSLILDIVWNFGGEK